MPEVGRQPATSISSVRWSSTNVDESVERCDHGLSLRPQACSIASIRTLLSRSDPITVVAVRARLEDVAVAADEQTDHELPDQHQPDEHQWREPPAADTEQRAERDRACGRDQIPTRLRHARQRARALVSARSQAEEAERHPERGPGGQPAQDHFGPQVANHKVIIKCAVT